MKATLHKCWWRIQYAVRVIDKATLKARLRAARLQGDGYGDMAQYLMEFAHKFGKGIYPGPHPFDVGKVDVGVGTYGALNVLAHGAGDTRLTIGRYCSIGPGVTFILNSEHPYKGMSTFPFRVKFGFCKAEAASKGDIAVGDDVWIGLNAIICSGVKIGQGAVVAAGSVVTKDVEPYSIVGGNPARLIKYRYEDESVRACMSKLDWSCFNREKVTADSAYRLYEQVSKDNIDTLVAEFFDGKREVEP